MFSKLFNLLKGKVTYISAAGFLCLAVADIIGGDLPNAKIHALQALAFFGLRRAIE